MTPPLELKARLGLAAALSTPHRAFVALDLTLQRKSAHAAEQARPDVPARRAARPALDPDRVVFVDETWAATDMTRTRGRSPRGRRLVCPVPHGHWKTTTFVAAQRSDRLTALMVIDGAMTGDLFVAYVRQVLVPELRLGDVMAMDYLQCHKRVEAARAVAAAGAGVRFLPPYSPDLKPIENAFPEQKGFLRAAERRTVEAQWGSSVKTSTPSHLSSAGTTSDTPGTLIHWPRNRSGRQPGEGGARLAGCDPVQFDTLGLTPVQEPSDCPEVGGPGVSVRQFTAEELPPGEPHPIAAATTIAGRFPTADRGKWPGETGTNAVANSSQSAMKPVG